MASSSDIYTTRCDWLHFAGRTGSPGRLWAERYRYHYPTLDIGKRALELIRHGQIQAGSEALAKFVERVDAVNNEQPSIRAVLDRYVHGVQAYYFYCLEDFDGARDTMWLAHKDVARALSTADWLRLLAVHCQEFRLHLARIARNQQRIPDMQRYIAEARAMMCDRLPLCETDDGRQILWSGFGSFFDTIRPLTSDEAHEVNALLDSHERESLFNQFVRNMLSSRTRVKYA